MGQDRAMVAAYVFFAAALCGQVKKTDPPPVKTLLTVKEVVSVRFTAFGWTSAIPITRESIRKFLEVRPKLTPVALAHIVKLLNADYPEAEFQDGAVRLRVATKRGVEVFVGNHREMWRWGRGWKMDKRSYQELVSFFPASWDGLPDR